MKDSIFSWKEILCITLMGMTGVAMWSHHMGQDLGPDLVNYHLYNGYLAFHKNLLVENIFPAGIQGYLNPYIYGFIYWLYQVFSPKNAGSIIGAMHGLCFVSVYVVTRTLLADWDKRVAILAAFLSAFAGVINPFFLSMAGSTFSDNLTPPLILLPLALILMLRCPRESDTSNVQHPFFLLFIAGMMIGTTVGLKLSNCAFVFGLAAAWLYRFRFTKMDMVGGAALFVGVVVGFLVVSAEWMWRLYTNFQSPLFPFYNKIFHSPMIGDIWTNVPARAAAHSLVEGLAYPFRWLHGKPPETEWNFQDARFAILSVLIAMLLVVRVLPASFRKAIHGRQPPDYILNRYWFMAIWGIVSYLFWIDQFGALRYLMPVTLLCAAAILICLTRLIRYKKISVVLWIVLMELSLYSMKMPPFGRVSWHHGWYPVKLPEKLLQSRNTLYLNEGPSLPIPFFPRDARFIGIGQLSYDDGSRKKAYAMIEHHSGPMRTLDYMPSASEFYTTRLAEFGLRRDPRDCVSFMAGVYPFQSCRAVRLQGNNNKPFVIASNTKMQLNDPRSAWINYMKGFSNPEPSGVWTQGKTVEIRLSGNLPEHFRIRLIAAATMGENGNLPLVLLIGNQKKTISFNRTLKTPPVTFKISANADRIIIKIPKAVSPHALDQKSSDMRELGVLLQSIVIEPVRGQEDNT